MIDINTVEDVYPAVREIIGELKNAGLEKTAAILTHRMTKVPWNSRSELFEELEKVLSETTANHQSELPVALADQIQRVSRRIHDFL